MKCLATNRGMQCVCVCVCVSVILCMQVEELRLALVGAARNDLAEELNSKYREVNVTAEKRLQGD